TLEKPLDHQLPVLESTARFKIFVGGRRVGKSTLSRIIALDGDAAGPGALRGAHVMIVCPTSKMGTEQWEKIQAALAGCWLDKSEVERTLKLPGGGRISVVSGDNPDHLRGTALDLLVLDEGAFLADQVWQLALRPSLSDRRGRLFAISTGRGCTGWFYETYVQAADAPGWGRWSMPTEANPVIPRHGIQLAR